MQLVTKGEENIRSKYSDYNDIRTKLASIKKKSGCVPALSISACQVTRVLEMLELASAFLRNRPSHTNSAGLFPFSGVTTLFEKRVIRVVRNA